MKGAKNVSGLIDSRTQYGRPGAGAPGQSGMCRHIFSHPDYDRRLWHLTRSADPDVREGRRALAGSPHCMAYRRWGIAPRPEDVLHVVLTTFSIVRLSGFCVGICLLRVGICSFRDGGWVGSFGAWRGGGPGSGFDTSPPLGRGVCLAFFCRAVWRWRILRGRQKRPRGRPFLAFGRGCGDGGRCAPLGGVAVAGGGTYFAVSAVAGVFGVSVAGAGLVTAGLSAFFSAGVSAFFFFFFGSASIVPRHGGVPHRQR